jgi:hypothetical protein
MEPLLREVVAGSILGSSAASNHNGVGDDDFTQVGDRS